MDKEEIILNKVVLMVSRIPKEVTIKVYKAIGVEKRNTYRISAMDSSGSGVMEQLDLSKVITKRNILNVDPCFRPSEISATTWCLNDQLPSAKEMCKGAMELYLLQHIKRANAMNDLFEEYKTKNLK